MTRPRAQSPPRVAAAWRGPSGLPVTLPRAALQVCEVSYARIQGKSALLAHFEHSSLMHEDEMMQPVVFASDGSGRREPFHWQQRRVPQAPSRPR